ncbi:MAG: DNA polymerase [Alphaproteobacteria bacterium]|nr:DNA polymerase [Alphaproteobacteria bacterium]
MDCECDGLLPEATQLFCVVLRSLDVPDHIATFTQETGFDGLKETLQASELLVGHNIIGFDLPLLEKLIGLPKSVCEIRDTLIIARLMFPDTAALDNLNKLPGKLWGRHSLEAWGHRLKVHKGNHVDFSIFSEGMLDYCIQDTFVTYRLWQFLKKQKWDERSITLEHEVAKIIQAQESRGFCFDVDKAVSLYTKLLDKKHTLTTALQELFPPWWGNEHIFVPKRDNKRLGYVAGVPVTKGEWITFNPSSRDHIADRLQAVYGWKPKELTPTNKPIVDCQSLGLLNYPPIPLLLEYLTIEKRLGQLAEGNQAWLMLERKGRLHGKVNTNGAVTGRMTHSNPNMAQVPANDVPYGKECRDLFIPSPGFVLVGCDAAALELRCLAGYMAPYDNGAYVQTVIGGEKSTGTDIHSVNQQAIGAESRDIAKTWFYAYIYGAGHAKLGEILSGNAALGKISKERFEKNLPALGKLVKAIEQTLVTRKYLKGLDGRKLYVRSKHAALNTLLQSAGAVLMKQALVLLKQSLDAEGLVLNKDYAFVANVHDEWQIEALRHLADIIGQKSVEAIKAAGNHFNFACPLDASYNIGSSWVETH